MRSVNKIFSKSNAGLHLHRFSCGACGLPFLEDFMNKLNRHLSEGIEVKSEAKIVDLNGL